jgi:cobalt-zinc-cadmium efflux system membrane fusion protein
MERTTSLKEKMKLIFRPATLLALLVGIALGGVLSLGLLRDSKPRPDSVPDQSSKEGHEEHSSSDVVLIEPQGQQNIGLKIAEAQERSVVGTLQTTGIVSPNETRLAHIRPLARGLIERVFVRLGDPVKAGQPLVRYDNIELGELIQEYLGALAQVEKEKANVEVSKRFEERAKALFESQAIAQKEYELREAEYKNAEATLERQRAELAKYEEKLHRFGLSDKEIDILRGAPHQQAHRTASHNVLRAPIAGIITKYDVSEGELVGPERELFTVTDTSIVWVLADVYEKDLSMVREGLQVKIYLETYPNEAFIGRITYVSDFLDPKTRSAKVRCEVSNPQGRLKLESFATIQIPTPMGRKAVMVPVAAVQRIDDAPVVFVKIGDAEFQRRKVQIGSQSNDWVEVASGVKIGEAVVTQGTFQLKSALLRERIGDEH